MAGRCITMSDRQRRRPAAACRLDESHLTGEADDALKRADRAPMMLSGSKVLEGYGRMLVTAVGLNSAQGRILSSLTEAPADAGGALRRARSCCAAMLLA